MPALFVAPPALALVPGPLAVQKPARRTALDPQGRSPPARPGRSSTATVAGVLGCKQRHEPAPNLHLATSLAPHQPVGLAPPCSLSCLAGLLHTLGGGANPQPVPRAPWREGASKDSPAPTSRARRSPHSKADCLQPSPPRGPLSPALHSDTGGGGRARGAPRRLRRSKGYT